ncbi:hypothetical protein J6590_087863 [Homalodisca vitripennis]|nr:hypothetical protein J6590_087863 [Homalodisca vitripennis]
MEDSLIRKASPGEARLKGRHPENWKKTKEKKQRNQPKMLPRMPTCGHNSKAYQCTRLSQRDVNHFHHIVYEVPDKIIQDGVILRYCNASTPKRSRQVKENSSRKASATNEKDKTRFIIAKRVHSLKYKEFFSALKKKEDSTMVLSYDCQKNQVLPKVPDRTNLNVFRSVLKSGKSYEALDPAIIQPGRAIIQAKFTDVKKLLTVHFGNGWERLDNLSFYTKLAEVGRDAEEDDGNICADTQLEDPLQLTCI